MRMLGSGKTWMNFQLSLNIKIKQKENEWLKNNQREREISWLILLPKNDIKRIEMSLVLTCGIDGNKLTK